MSNPPPSRPPGERPPRPERPAHRAEGRPNRPMLPRGKVNAGRLAAARALLEIDRGAHAEEALARLAPADPGDRALAWNLVLGVLRVRSALDELITTAAQRALRTIDREVVAALRIGIYEARWARVPAYAAVDQAVELTRALGTGHASGFVNAVLRKQDALTPSAEAMLGHPDWLVARWRARYGADADRWMAASNTPAPVFLVAKEDPAGVCRDFQHRGLTLVPAQGPDGPYPDVFQLPAQAGAIPDLPGFAEGRWWVMDPAAVAVADLIGEVPPGGEVLDTCAAPGGKSFRMASAGVPVVATDVDEARLARVREGAERLGLPVTARVHDWAAGPLDRRFPAVLLDAPCTSLGVLRRHPDIRWRRTPDDIAALVERQRAILANVARSVAPGGALVYAVCSPEPEEGIEVASSLGWPVEATFSNAPAVDGQDTFQAFRLRAPAR